MTATLPDKAGAMYAYSKDIGSSEKIMKTKLITGRLELENITNQWKEVALKNQDLWKRLV